MYLLIVFLPLLGSSVAGFFGRFLGAEGTAIMTTPEFILPLFLLVVILTIIYRILLSKKKKSFLLLFKIIISIFTIFVVSLVRDSVCFHFFSVGAIASTCMMMDASGGYYDSSSSGTVGAICGFPSTSEALEDASSLRFLEPKGLPNADSPVQLLEIPPQAEPSVSAEGPAPHGENPAIPAPAREPIPLGQPSIVKNSSLESSIQNRIKMLENDNTIFLLDKERGGYWNYVTETLNQAPTQLEYNSLLECENWDLQIRERKHYCFSLFKQILLEHPALAENAAYNPQEAFIDFFDERRDELNTHGDWSPKQKDLKELQFLDLVAHDLREFGPNSIYITRSLFFDK